jgi:hypothetical protein
MFLGYQEVNYRFVDLSIVRRLKVNKFMLTSLHHMTKINVIFYFWFRQLNEFDLTTNCTYNHLLLIWLITRQRLEVSKFNSRLVRGNRFFRYVFRTTCIFRNIFLVLDFFINFLLKAVIRGSFKLLDLYNNNSTFTLTDLNPFSNIRISNALYLPTVSDRLYIKFHNSSKLIPITKELNFYKFI